MRHLLIYILLPSLSLFSLLTLSSFAYQYGPVKPGETLWSIAKKVRPNTSVSITKMMQMIQKNNPHAFNNNSASSLMENTTLIIPAIATTKQLKPEQLQLTRTEQRQQLLRQLAKNKQHVSTQNITKLKEELKLSKIRFKKIEDRNQELLKKMQKLHLQLQKLQAKMLKGSEQRHSLNTHTTQNNSDS
ncbi:FimV/HubP family polar landmark protein [Piscirickettsia salmonis]|uniref:FimV/HubP family polar landmark protein n=1 Tax=Piscirickettsia salmonis TaxID=1238 RepID=UPI0012BADC18|nr:FimV/HubP family polar landmark protein [Piscirickettsia salmonis]QGP59395.1 hypothetical protein PsalBI1_01983 [Piscirickettsia salmonis]